MQFPHGKQTVSVANPLTGDVEYTLLPSLHLSISKHLQNDMNTNSQDNAYGIWEYMSTLQKQRYCLKREN